jgi:FKBP-type peptidyl-prolyl cis-trans isomerase FklB
MVHSPPPRLIFARVFNQQIKPMTKSISLVAVMAVALSSCDGQDSKPVDLTSSSDSASYAIGVSIGTGLLGDFKAEGLDSNLNMDLLLAGFRQALITEDAVLNEEQANTAVQGYLAKLGEEKAEKNKAIGEKFLAENKGKANVITTESGLQYIAIKEGEGTAPTVMDQVKVHYTGKLMNGEVFDSSEDRGEPVTFYLRSVIPGWTEVLQLMKPGAEYKVFIPGQLAYGPNGGPKGSGIGPNEVLLFDIKLIDVIAGEAPKK